MAPLVVDTDLKTVQAFCLSKKLAFDVKICTEYQKNLRIIGDVRFASVKIATYVDSSGLPTKVHVQGVHPHSTLFYEELCDFINNRDAGDASSPKVASNSVSSNGNADAPEKKGDPLSVEKSPKAEYHYYVDDGKYHGGWSYEEWAEWSYDNIQVD